MWGWFNRVFGFGCHDVSHETLDQGEELVNFTIPCLDLQAWSCENWSRVCEDDRRRGLDHLWTVIDSRYPGGPEALAKWRRQVAAGIDIGSDDPWFHHSAGMSVRNILRQVLTDDKLPGVIYPPQSGLPVAIVRNWDDFYIGALVALVKEEAA